MSRILICANIASSTLRTFDPALIGGDVTGRGRNGIDRWAIGLQRQRWRWTAIVTQLRSASVNAMLDVIMGLLEESRNQRDALANAADHLFSDMRVVSAGDLRVNAEVRNDPIGMLANAFNFTVGRFAAFHRSYVSGPCDLLG